MLTAKILNTSATLNNFVEINNINFISNEDIIIKIRLHNPDIDLRYIPSINAIVTFYLPRVDGTTLNKIGLFFEDDRSMITLNVTKSESIYMSSGDIFFEIIDGPETIKGIIINGLVRYGNID